MRYRLSEIAMTRPPASLSLVNGAIGLGILVLPHCRPIGFLTWESVLKPAYTLFVLKAGSAPACRVPVLPPFIHSNGLDV
jgi:hypothetical protein